MSRQTPSRSGFLTRSRMHAIFEAMSDAVALAGRGFEQHHDVELRAARRFHRAPATRCRPASRSPSVGVPGCVSSRGRAASALGLVNERIDRAAIEASSGEARLIR